MDFKFLRPLLCRFLDIREDGNTAKIVNLHFTSKLKGLLTDSPSELSAAHL